jgi:hypothetical protein
VISYCIAAFRPTYARLLLEDLVRKTSTPYELLVWVNVADASFDDYLRALGREAPLTIVGRTPENIGMAAFRELFAASRYPLITQFDDDVVCVSRGMAERAARVFEQCANLRQVVADVWQDEFTTGARPPLAGYRCIDAEEGLYEGPIDGWCSVYHRSILPLLASLPYRQYFPLGGLVRQSLRQRGLRGLLCTRMRVFHVIGPEYASLFGMREFEMQKYSTLGRTNLVEWYANPMPEATPAVLQTRWAGIVQSLDSEGPW